MTQELRLIMEGDLNLTKLGSISTVHNPKDANHLERRQQQRGITNPMIEVALIYGKRQFSHGALTFTITDRRLKNTPYKRFIDALRGLRVVCLDGPPNPKVMTAYWHEKTKRRVHR